MNRSCKVYNDTFLTNDEFECDILQLAGSLYIYDFGYICMIPLSLIIIISIFGKLNGNYQWFILNQAFWDFLSSSDYSCNNKFGTIKTSPPPCFYFTKRYFTNVSFWLTFWDEFIKSVTTSNIFSSLFFFVIDEIFSIIFSKNL